MKKLFAILAVMGVLSFGMTQTRHRQNRLQQLTKQKQHRLL